MEGSFFDADLRRDTGDATLVPSEINVDDIDWDRRGALRLSGSVDIRNGGQARRLGEGEHFKLSREAEACFLQQLAELVIDQDRGREIGDAEEALLDHPADDIVQVGTRIEGRRAEEDRHRGPRQDFP